MSDGRDSPSQSGLRDRVHFFEKVWSGQSSNDTVDATTDVDEIERRIEQRKRRPESPKIEVKLKHTRDGESPTKTFESSFPNLKLRHVEPAEEVERIERQVEEGDLAAGVRFVKFERVVKRTVTETRSEERAESPQHEWYSEYQQQTWQTAPRMEFMRSKSEYDSHIAEKRGKFLTPRRYMKLQWTINLIAIQQRAHFIEYLWPCTSVIITNPKAISC
ncbi:hypothetical protein B5X24_HaOG213657 [Helicoverpa armigera]|uniref:Uncharacterized protein n=1 Tax=Helicoverpa armigera TaxID=29058 RepID=A0A2W1BEI6_HELAM|nr:hypothetical protein B5X24_HaOG213657 [Helicoverpa armigera]